MTEAKRVKCDFCGELYHPEATRIHPWVSGNPPKPIGISYRRCIDCAEKKLNQTDDVLREALNVIYER
jgi:hypothetical protein